MLEETTYICEICGKRSLDRAEIERCEANVRKPKYGPGHKFSFLAAPYIPGQKQFISEGVIECFDHFEQGTHDPWYRATCTRADGTKHEGHKVYEWLASQNDKDKI